MNFAVPAIVGDASLCEKCSLCVKFCPCGIIDAYTFEVPESKKEQCMHCTSCIHHCPYHIRIYGQRIKSRLRSFLMK
ncbi:4Fe-4S dicluster domain-containing protein [Anaerobiospirillum thomasii]|uniref:4Fe-4S dicluster domain-containing protein n=1 Tax=Anaerobiospirillum thomasii TaxID=179995 RepID=UPI0011BE4B30